jgi:sugar (pentulose or hexulose) kinase
MGIDYGTSGARCTVIDERNNIVEEHKTTYDADKGGKASPEAWQQGLSVLFDSVSEGTKSALKSIAIDGTSGTAMLVDGKGHVMTPLAKMYNETQPERAVAAVAAIAPDEHTTLSSNSTLAKAFAFLMEIKGTSKDTEELNLLHQADYIGYLLHGKLGHSDWNNSLKLGFDPAAEQYPSWIIDCKDVYAIIPKHVHRPGKPVGVIAPRVAELYQVNRDCVICAGTTDSIAAFLAAGVDQPGQSVTSLGSTMAIKLISEKEVNSSSFGVYSHRLGDSWLVGGASNTGGSVLRQLFTDLELIQLTERMNIDSPTGTDYVVLPAKGDRFPINDMTLEPMLEPRPEDDAEFLQGILEAMSRTEARAYELLASLGATPVTEVYTCGGGSQNPKWTELRRRCIGVDVMVAKETEASYGAALLAKKGAMGRV